MRTPPTSTTVGSGCHSRPTCLYGLLTGTAARTPGRATTASRICPGLLPKTPIASRSVPGSSMGRYPRSRTWRMTFSTSSRVAWWLIRISMRGFWPMRLTIRGRKQIAAPRQADPYRLGADLRVRLATLLDGDAGANVLLRSELRLAASLDGWWGLGERDQLRAVLMTGSVVVPWIPDPGDIPAFAGVLRQHFPRLIIGRSDERR